VDPFARLAAEIEESRALTLALVELLAEKKIVTTAYPMPMLTQADVAAMMQKKQKMVERFAEEREKKARGLVLPPGAMG